jgi:ribosomal protein S7
MAKNVDQIEIDDVTVKIINTICEQYQRESGKKISKEKIIQSAIEAFRQKPSNSDLLSVVQDILESKDYSG